MPGTGDKGLLQGNCTPTQGALEPVVSTRQALWMPTARTCPQSEAPKVPARPSGAGRRKPTILLCLRPADGQPGVLDATGVMSPGNESSRRSGTEVSKETGEEAQKLTAGSAGLTLLGRLRRPLVPQSVASVKHAQSGHFLQRSRSALAPVPLGFIDRDV